MFSFYTLRHTSTHSTNSKSKHKNARSKTHKVHAKHRDPGGRRNAKKKYRLPSKIWLKGVESLKRFNLAVKDAAVDKKGRPRTDIGHAVVASFPNFIQASLQSLPIRDLFDVMHKTDEVYQSEMDKLFPGCKRIDARHTDKIRLHYESHIIKYDDLGEKLYESSKEMKADASSVTAVAAKQAVKNKGETQLGKSGNRWNALASVRINLKTQDLIREKLIEKSEIERRIIQEKAENWFRRLEKEMSDLGKDRRKKRDLIADTEIEMEKLLQFKEAITAEKPQKPAQNYPTTKEPSPKKSPEGPSI